MATEHSTRTSRIMTDKQVMARARSILKARLTHSHNLLSSTPVVREYLQFGLAELQHEVFFVLFLDTQNRLIASEELFRGTLTQTSVYPREVVKRALHHNAAAVILAHNHPSGCCKPSRADEVVTYSLKQALQLVDIQVLDHFIVAGEKIPLSFAERGLI